MENVINTDLKILSQERPLKTSELYKANDCYGHAYILKKYAGLKSDYQIKGILEHAAMLYDHVWSFDISVPLPVIFCFSDYRFLFLRQLTNKVLFAIGPSIHYAEPLLSDIDLKEIRNQLGKTLLIFLPHSSWSIYVDFDIKYIISIIKKIEKEFENILICIGWRDVLRNIDEFFINEGYTCVTAGNVYDNQFLNRLKTLILLSSHTMSFSFGTHIGFCIYLNRPHWIFEEVKQKISVPDKIRDTSVFSASPLSINEGRYIIEHFREAEDVITDKQKEIIDLIWGTSHIKTPSEIKELFSIAEDMYREKYFPCDRKNLVGLCQIIDYIKKNELNKFYFLLNYLKKIGISYKWINLLEGLLLIKKGNFIKAEKKIKRLLKDKGFIGERAKLLMTKIQNQNNEIEFFLKEDIMSIYPKPNFFSLKKINIPWRNL